MAISVNVLTTLFVLHFKKGKQPDGLELVSSNRGVKTTNRPDSDLIGFGFRKNQVLTDSSCL